MKTFKDDFVKFKNKILNKEPFALSRANDGEMIIIFNEYINLLNKYNGEFIYNPNDQSHLFFRDKLIESTQYVDDKYYVGVGCRCCIGNERHERIKNITGLDDEHLTWGNIFVNSNYNSYYNELMPLFNNYNVVMVVNHKANLKNLPFYDKIVKVFNVGTNAWMSDYKLIDDITKYIKDNNINNTLFLFAAGPFSNILILECFKINKNNTYLDIGSTLDNIMNLGATRGYLRGADTLYKTCIW